MEELKGLLSNKYGSIDFDKEKHLISDGIIDSVDMVSIISEIEEHYGIEITMEYIKPEYFESVEAMWGMIEEIR